MYSAAIVPLPNMRLLLLAHSGLAFDSPNVYKRHHATTDLKTITCSSNV
jgi:hypothetical protein